MSSLYDIRRGKAEDIETIIQFLNINFWPEEPMCKAVNLLPVGYRSSYLENWMRVRLEHRGAIIFVAERKSDLKMIGVGFSNFLQPGEQIQEPEENSENRTERIPVIFKKVLELLELTDSKAHIATSALMNQPHVYHQIMCSDSSSRIPGVGTAIFVKMREAAWEAGAKWQSVIATSFFTAKIFNKFGMQMVGSVDYADFKDEGKTVFNTQSPHTTQKYFLLQQENNTQG